jgi:hypothetical protein
MTARMLGDSAVVTGICREKGTPVSDEARSQTLGEQEGHGGALRGNRRYQPSGIGERPPEGRLVIPCGPAVTTVAKLIAPIWQDQRAVPISSWSPTFYSRP